MSRSATFFQSDLYATAETAAFAMEDHGLTPEQVEALAERINDTISAFFRELHLTPDGEARLASVSQSPTHREPE